MVIVSTGKCWPIWRSDPMLSDLVGATLVDNFMPRWKALVNSMACAVITIAVSNPSNVIS